MSLGVIIYQLYTKKPPYNGIYDKKNIAKH